jgi:hypothetical protein
MAILLVVVIGVLSSVAFAYTSSNGTEMHNTAKNIATYTLEYLRARTVTNPGTGAGSGLGQTLGISPSSTGTYGWYAAAGNANGAFPSMVDARGLPVQSDGYPCSYSAAHVKANNTHDGDPNESGGTAIRFASKHAALPTEKYATREFAWSSTLQGYVSVSDAGTLGLIVRYPGVYPSTQPVITSFTPGATYLARVYTTDAAKIDETNQAYSPHYTDADKEATQAYRGFRVLTQVVARSTAALDTNNYRHVQYYDVSVTVFWMNGTQESNYELVSRILVY